jgi:hypothetical protein
MASLTSNENDTDESAPLVCRMFSEIRFLRSQSALSDVTFDNVEDLAIGTETASKIKTVFFDFPITNDNVNSVANMIENLQTVNDFMIRHFPSNQTHQDILLSGLAKNKTIVTLTIIGKHTEVYHHCDFFNVLSGITTLKDLRIVGIGVDLLRLYSGIESSKSLHNLELSDCFFEDSFLVAFAALMNQNKTLKKLELFTKHENIISSANFGKAFCTLIKGQSGLTTLKTNYKLFLSSESFTMLLAGLRTNQKLQNLTFDLCTISEWVVKDIGFALKKNKGIRYFEFGNDDLSVHEETFALCISSNKSLLNIRFGYKTYYSDGTCYLGCEAEVKHPNANIQERLKQNQELYNSCSSSSFATTLSVATLKRASPTGGSSCSVKKYSRK